MTLEATIHETQGSRILEYPARGASLGNVSSSLEMIGAARSQGAAWIVVPIERLGREFFNLRNGIAGEVLQKFVTYRLRVAILGEISPLSGVSEALRDFVIECNRGSSVWFVRSLQELNDRLRRTA